VLWPREGNTLPLFGLRVHCAWIKSGVFVRDLLPFISFFPPSLSLRLSPSPLPTQLTALGNPIAPNAAVHPNSGIITPQVKEKKPHIKKPLNAFMLFMKEKRADVIKECTLKESAAINQILGKMVRKKERVEEGSCKLVSV